MGKDATKRLFIDHYCLGVLNNFLTPEDFKSKKIELSSIQLIDQNEKDLTRLNSVTEEIALFIIQPSKEILNVVIEMHIMLKSFRSNLSKNIVFIPGETYDIIEFLTTNNLLAEFKIFNLNVDLIPIDYDLLSLEREDSLKEIFIDKNLSSIGDLASALVKLETCFGKVKYKYIKGDLAQTFDDIVTEKEKENDLHTNDEILGMIALDRSVDFISLVMTNYTYEGLIDSTLGINFGKIKIKENILKENLSNNVINSEKNVTFGLTSKVNPFYCQLRCMHYLDAKSYLDQLRIHYQNIAAQNKKNLSLGEIRKLTDELNYFMNNVKENMIMNNNILAHVTKSLTDTGYFQYIEKEQLMVSGDLPTNLHSYYDIHLCEQRDIFDLIKLMIVESLTQNGVQDYQKLKREILNVYGFQKVFLFRDLENMGWLKEKELMKNIKKKIIDITYNEISGKLELIDPQYNPKNIDNCSYVAGGYCPLGLRIIEKAAEGKWGKIADVLKRMSGACSFPQDENVISNPEKERNTIFVVFVGGVTYTEIAGIRYLNRKFNENYKNKKGKKIQLIILTTDIISQKKIFKRFGKDLHSSLNMKMFYEQSQK